MKKVIYILTIISLLYSQAFAYNPFDVLHQQLPDLTVSNIFQETNSEYIDMTICNIGGSMDQNGDIALGVKNNNSGMTTNTLIKYIKLASGDCTSYRVGSIRNMGVYSAGSYNVKGAVKLSYYKLEENSYNNSRTTSIYLSSNSYGTNSNSNVYGNDQYYCNGRRYTYGTNDTSYYCGGTRYSRNNHSNTINNNYNSTDKYYCGGTRYNYNSVDDKSYYCNGTRYSRNNNNSSSNTNNQYYCNGTRYSYGTNDTSYYCNGSRYNRYNNNSSSNSYNNGYYCSGTWHSLSQSDTGYYCNGTWYNRYSNSDNYNNDQYYCNGSRYSYTSNSDVAYYCNGTWYARNNSVVNYNFNNADLQIEVINSSYSNRRINAKICNKGGDMGKSYTVRTIFYSSTTGKSVTKDIDVNLAANACSYTDVYASYSDLGFYYSGNVSINARMDILNYNEKNTNNNEVTNSIWIDY